MSSSASHRAKQCPACPYTAGPTSEVVGKVSGYTHKITRPVNCQDTNIIYYWQCIKDIQKMNILAEVCRASKIASANIVIMSKEK